MFISPFSFILHTSILIFAGRKAHEYYSRIKTGTKDDSGFNFLKLTCCATSTLIAAHSMGFNLLKNGRTNPYAIYAVMFVALYPKEIYECFKDFDFEKVSSSELLKTLVKNPSNLLNHVFDQAQNWISNITNNGYLTYSVIVANNTANHSLNPSILNHPIQSTEEVTGVNTDDNNHNILSRESASRQVSSGQNIPTSIPNYAVAIPYGGTNSSRM